MLASGGRCREFKLAEDMFAQDSIELLKLSGINFAENESRGIDVHRFGELLMSSGIVLNEEVRHFCIARLRTDQTAQATHYAVNKDTGIVATGILLYFSNHL